MSGRRFTWPYWLNALLIILFFMFLCVICVFSYFFVIGPRFMQAMEPDKYPKMADRPTWNTVADTKIADEIPLAIYQSKLSNLRVAVASVPGPMVKGVISFVTETHSDDGLPHTLEHLVFMGSKSYPYKGILDILANLNFASGTNAWTAQDHTAYTLNTVGSKGFLKVLPVYIDHCLDPTLTEAQYMTEVHHINGKGEDAGVVYSEMQNFESDMSMMVNWARSSAMYPEGNEYGVEAGGRLENLRNSTTNAKVRDFHKKFYNLNNMMIIVLGIIDHNDLLAAVEPSERHFLAAIPPDFQQPFTAVIPPLNNSVTVRVETPTDDAVSGMVELAWFGPKATDLYECTALDVLFDYLADTANSPLMMDFVQMEDPYAGKVTVSNTEQETTAIVMDFTGVPINKLELVVDRFFNKTLADHEDKTKFDMARMGFLINQTIQKVLESLETDPATVLNAVLIVHQIYGDRANFEGSLAERVNFVGMFHKLALEDATFWRDLMQKYFTKPFVCVIGQPSVKMVKTIEAKELQRIEEQKRRLGEDGLKECEAQIEEANRENNENEPSEVLLKKFMVDELEDFHDIKISLSDNFNGESSPIIGNLPVPAFLHDIHTKFIEVHALFDTLEIPYELRKYGMLWYSCVFQTSAMIDGAIVSYEDVAVLATKEVVSQSIEPGFAYSYDRLMHMQLKVDANHINRAAKWLNIYLNQVIFEPERVAMTLNKLISSADDAKRDANVVLVTAHTQATYLNDTNAYIDNVIALQKFHQDVLSQLQNNSGQAVIDNLNEFRRLIVSSPVNIHIACDRRLVESVDVGDMEMWNFLSRSQHRKKEKINVTSDEDISKESLVGGLQRAVAIGASESSFLKQSALFPQDWNGDDLVETMLLIKYLEQLEGPLYKGVRGRGLAYTVFLEVEPDKSLISATLYRCSQAVQAYKALKSIVMNILKNRTLDEFEFEGAKRSLICDLYAKRDSIQSVVKQSVLEIYRNTTLQYTRELTKRIWSATVDQVFVKASPYLEALFDDSKSVRSIVVPPSKLNETMNYFEGIQVMELSNLQIQ